MNIQFESCPYCGKGGLKRSHSSLYELNGWLHICKTEPLRTNITWNKHDSRILKDDELQGEEWPVGSYSDRDDYVSWGEDSY